MATENNGDTSDAMKYGFASDVELNMAGGNSTPYEVLPSGLVKITLVSFAITVLSYLSCRLFGKIIRDQHSGLCMFWRTMTFGEVCSSAACLLTTAILFVYDSKDGNDVLCSEVRSDLNVFGAYGCLIVWVIFVSSILRSVTSITWLHKVRDIDRLIDMGRGIGILACSLLFLIPLALVGRHSIEVSTETEASITVCLPVWKHTLSSNVLRLIATGAYVLGGLLSNSTEQHNKSSSSLSSVLVVITHFAPIFFFSSWSSVLMERHGYPDMFLVIYSMTCAVNSLCNVCCYRLYLLSYPSDKTVCKCDKEACESDEKK